MSAKLGFKSQGHATPLRLDCLVIVLTCGVIGLTAYAQLKRTSKSEPLVYKIVAKHRTIPVPSRKG